MFAESTRVAFLKFRLRFGLFDESRWLAYALFLFTLPLPVRENRFAALLFVLIFILLLLCLLRGEHHDHGPAFRLGLTLDNGQLGHIVADALEHDLGDAVAGLDSHGKRL